MYIKDWSNKPETGSIVIMYCMIWSVERIRNVRLFLNVSPQCECIRRYIIISFHGTFVIAIFTDSTSEFASRQPNFLKAQTLQSSTQHYLLDLSHASGADDSLVYVVKHETFFQRTLDVVSTLWRHFHSHWSRTNQPMSISTLAMTSKQP